MDNAKFWLAALVVVGHALLLPPTSELRNQSYGFVYAFHMPAFILISGYLSRRFTWSRRHLVALVTTLLVPYFFLELTMAWWRVEVAGTVSDWDALSPLWLVPHWPTWFLVVLAMWRLATPVLVRHWIWIPLSVVISLVSGLHDFTWLDGNRFFGMLPFFVIGLHADRLIEMLRPRWTALLGVLVLGWIWTRSVGSYTSDDLEWFYYRSAYEVTGHSFVEGALARSEMLAIGLLGTLAALAVIPRRRHFFTAMGAASMVIYLFHGFLVKWAKGNEWRELFPEDETAAVLVVIAASLALAFVLGSPWVARWLGLLADPWNQVVMPAVRRLKGQDRGAAPAPAQGARGDGSHETRAEATGQDPR